MTQKIEGKENKEKKIDNTHPVYIFPTSEFTDANTDLKVTDSSIF